MSDKKVLVIKLSSIKIILKNFKLETPLIL
jgi:hypothetical protein